MKDFLKLATVGSCGAMILLYGYSILWDRFDENIGIIVKLLAVFVVLLFITKLVDGDESGDKK